jgi:hypothetical protein
MQTPGKKIVLTAFGMLLLIVCSMPSYGERDHADDQRVEKKRDAHEEHNHGTNPLLEEMVMLDGVFRDVVSAVAMNDGKRVHAALERMHGAMEKTHAGVHHGTVKLRKNAHRLNEFVERDKEFHKKLERLAHAAQDNDQTAMVALTKQLLDDCIACHRDFRKP